MGIDRLCLRQRFLIGNQRFEVQGQRLLDVVQRFLNGRAGRETARDIWHRYAIVRVGIFVYDDWKFHSSLLVLLTYWPY
ncbi:hypothetical protein D3C76_1783810 [compost metagenome]